MVTTACLRDEAPRDVPARVVSVEEYVDEQQQDIDEAEATRFEAVAEGWALLGLQEERDYRDVLEAYYDTVGAFYDPRRDAVTILHRGSPLDDDAMMATLVHEFSHALQHHAVEDRENQVALTTDAYLARSAIVEGDATRTTDQALMLTLHADPSKPNWRRVYRTWSDLRRAAHRGEALRITLASRYFVYSFGSEFTQAVADDAGAEYLKEVYGWVQRPPLTARAIMSGPERAQAIDTKAQTAYDGFPRVAEADSVVAETDAGAAATAVDAWDAGARRVADAASETHSRLGFEAGTDEGRNADVQWVGPDLLVPVLEGHRLLDADAVGSFVLEAYAAEIEQRLLDSGHDDENLATSAGALVADSLTVWKSDSRTAVVHRLLFETEAVTRRWQRALDQVSPGTRRVRTHRDGKALVLVSANDTGWLDDLNLADLEWQRRTAGDVARELYPPDVDSNSAALDTVHGAWRVNLRGGCPSRPGALLQGAFSLSD